MGWQLGSGSVHKLQLLASAPCSSGVVRHCQAVVLDSSDQQCSRLTAVISGLCLQVSRSVEYVQSGTTALQDAKQLQKKTRKWMCCAIILLLVTAAVIVLVVRGWAGSISSIALHLQGICVACAMVASAQVPGSGFW